MKVFCAYVLLHLCVRFHQISHQHVFQVKSNSQGTDEVNSIRCLILPLKHVQHKVKYNMSWYILRAYFSPMLPMLTGAKENTMLGVRCYSAVLSTYLHHHTW